MAEKQINPSSRPDPLMEAIETSEKDTGDRRETHLESPIPWPEPGEKAPAPSEEKDS